MILSLVNTFDLEVFFEAVDECLSETQNIQDGDAPLTVQKLNPGLHRYETKSDNEGSVHSLKRITLSAVAFLLILSTDNGNKECSREQR